MKCELDMYIKKIYDKSFFLWICKIQNYLSRKSILDHTGVSVSLTSYGLRVNTVFYTIESIASGDIRPSRLILWLDNDFDFNKLPLSLLKLKKRGLEIRKTENLGPHKKYFPYVNECFDESTPLVTADDDILYPKYWLAKLLSTYKQNPNLVICYRAHKVKLNENLDHVDSFYLWTMCTNDVPSFLNHATGCSGVIYSPFMQRALIKAGDSFKNKCLFGDDIWLHAVALRNGIKIKQVYKKHIDFTAIPFTQKSGLKWENASGKNDIQANLTYTKVDIMRMIKDV